MPEIKNPKHYFLQILQTEKIDLIISIFLFLGISIFKRLSINAQQISYKNKEMEESTCHLNIMVIGASGAGKSSLINLFYVWSLGIQATELGKLEKVLIQTAYLDGHEQPENFLRAVTNSPKFYSFELYNKDKKIKYKLTFLNTPGLGGIRCLERDDQKISQIIDSVQKIQNLNAIIWMMNGSDPRINSRVKYILVKLQKMLPNTFQQNLFVLLSNVDLKPNLKIQNQIEVDQSKITFFNNQDYEDQDLLYQVGKSYQSSFRTLSHLLGQISKCTFKPTQIFKMLKTNEYYLKKNMNECIDTLQNIRSEKNYLHQYIAEISRNEFQISHLRSDLTHYRTQEVIVSNSTFSHNTSFFSCKQYCRYNYGFSKTGIQGCIIFQTCTAFNGSQLCKKCGHHYQSHVLLNQIFTKKMIQVRRIKIEVQDQIYRKEDQKAKIQACIASSKKRIDELDTKLIDLHKEIEKYFVKMKGICLKFDWIKEIQVSINILEQQIEQLMGYASNGDSYALQKLQQNKEIKKYVKQLKDNLSKHLPQGV